MAGLSRHHVRRHRILREFGELMGAQEGPHQYRRRARHAEDRRSRQSADEALRRQGIFDDGRVLSLPDDRAPTRARSCSPASSAAAARPEQEEEGDLQKWLYLRSDRDFGMVWIKREGKGRVFNSVLGHRPDFYMMPDLVKLMLGGIQFVLGNLEADTTPSVKLPR